MQVAVEEGFVCGCQRALNLVAPVRLVDKARQKYHPVVGDHRKLIRDSGEELLVEGPIAGACVAVSVPRKVVGQKHNVWMEVLDKLERVVIENVPQPAGGYFFLRI